MWPLKINGLAKILRHPWSTLKHQFRFQVAICISQKFRFIRFHGEAMDGQRTAHCYEPSVEHVCRMGDAKAVAGRVPAQACSRWQKKATARVAERRSVSAGAEGEGELLAASGAWGAPASAFAQKISSRLHAHAGRGTRPADRLQREHDTGISSVSRVRSGLCRRADGFYMDCSVPLVQWMRLLILYGKSV